MWKSSLLLSHYVLQNWKAIGRLRRRGYNSLLVHAGAMSKWQHLSLLPPSGELGWECSEVKRRKHRHSSNSSPRHPETLPGDEMTENRTCWASCSVNWQTDLSWVVPKSGKSCELPDCSTPILSVVLTFMRVCLPLHCALLLCELLATESCDLCTSSISPKWFDIAEEIWFLLTCWCDWEQLCCQFEPWSRISAITYFHPGHTFHGVLGTHSLIQASVCGAKRKFLPTRDKFPS